MKYFKLKHGKWHCAKQVRNKIYFGPDGLIYFDSVGKPAAGVLATGEYLI